jgi:hypothetical protein
VRRVSERSPAEVEHPVAGVYAERRADRHRLLAAAALIGDDPISESVSLRVDGTAAVRRGGGGRGYWEIALDVTPAETERALRLVQAAP